MRRRVRCLRLRAPSPESAQRFQVALEDALHTASLPAADSGRVVVIRRLNLGRVPPQASSNSLALRLEEAIRAVTALALPADTPAAASANAVSFKDRTEVLRRLLERLLSRQALTEWYWRAALPTWDPQLPRAHAIRELLGQAHSLPEGAVAAPALIEALIRARALDELLAAVPPGQGRHWLRKLGWTPPRPLGGSLPGDHADAPTPAPHSQSEPTPVPPAARAVIHSWGLEDDRSIWLATLLLLCGSPARSADPHLPQRARAWLSVPGFPLPRPSAANPPTPPTPNTSADSTFPARVPPATPGTSHPEASPRSPLAPAIRPRSHPPTTPPILQTTSGPLSAAIQPIPQLAVATTTTGTTTAAGGLLFVVRALTHLGLPAALAADASLIESGFAPRLLLNLAERTKVARDDPMALALRELAGAGDDNSFARATAPEAGLREWRRRLRRWCRQEARLGLWNLIRRPGRFSATPTHLEVSFDLDQADLRLRRVGLDLDPGWVPWLGRVIHFHYD